ncbi:HU family DNA-binding protein [Azospirillum brasilense]|nr:HU family DNA-binding protein [Azospirillum brasilense]QEL99321.1 HU family DNA-binding protein [Azospirillum brasilense]
MTKADLIDAIAGKLGGTKADAGKALDAVLESLQDALVKGETVKLPGFGQFEIAERGERTGRNPQTGAEIKIAASKAPKFSAPRPTSSMPGRCSCRKSRPPMAGPAPRSRPPSPSSSSSRPG